MLKSMRLLIRALPLLVPMLTLLVMLAARFGLPEVFDAFQLQVFDTYQRLKPRVYTPVPVKIIDVDDESLARIGHWPWPRTRLAELLNRLLSGGPSVVALDLLLAESDRTSPENVLPLWPSTPELEALRGRATAFPKHDEIFADSMQNGAVVAGFVLTQVPSAVRPAEKARIEVLGSDPRPYLRNFEGAVVSLPAIEAAAVGNGSFNFAPERDGVIRRLHLMFRLGETIYPTLAAEALRVAQGADDYVIRTAADDRELGSGAQPGVNTISIGALRVPTEREGQVWLHHTRYESSRHIPAWRVLEPDFDPGRLAGNIVLIGTSAAGLKDIRATPLNPVASGVEMHAALIEQVLLGHFLRRPAWAEPAELVLLAALGLTLVLLLPVLRALWCALLGALVVALVVGFSWYAYTELRLLLDPVAPSLAALVVYLTGSLTNFFVSETERRQVRNAFGHYLAPAVIEQLLADPSRLRLSGEKRETTFLFTDIAGFTSLSEGMKPEVLVRLLNEYLEGTCEIVLRHGGTIDKIVGDALHVMFNAPSDQPDHGERAVSCALALDEFCQDFAARQAELDISMGHTRIGVNTGLTVVGNFGGESRFDYTAHGDAINTAARLESVNRYLGTRICVSQSTRELCPQLEFRPIAHLVLRGKREPIQVFEPWPNSTDDRAALMRDYLVAYELMDKEDPSAPQSFRALAERYPEDGVIAYHAKRLARGNTGTTILMTAK